MGKHNDFKRISAIALSFSVATTAWAAPIDSYEQQQRAKRQEMEQQYRIEQEQQSRPKEEKPPKAAQPIFPSKTASFYVKNIVIDDCGTGEFRWANKYVEQYKEQKLTLTDVVALQKAISDGLVKRGFVTSQVVVPEQDFKSKTLKFLIIPGYLENIKFADEKMYGTWHNAFPCQKGDILNSHKLELGLENMRKASNQQVEMKIEPGSKTGWSIVVLKIKRSKTWTVDISWDDAGQDSTGQHELTTGLTLHNPTGLNDMLYYSYTKDTEGHEEEKGIHNCNLYYTIPMGKVNLTASKFSNKYRQTFATAEDELVYEGVTDTWEIGGTQEIYRDNLRKTQVAAKLIRRHKKNYAGGENLGSQELNTAAYQIGINHRQYVGQGMLDCQLYYQKGMPWLGAKPGYEDDMEDGCTTRYGLYGWNFYYGTPLKIGSLKTQYSCTFRGQYTGDKLYGSDHFSIGGRYSVRGYNGENTLAAEKGFVVRQELGLPVGKTPLQFYLGIDYGRVWGPSDTFNKREYLVGGFVGLKGNMTKQIYFDVFVSRPIRNPEGFAADNVTIGFNINLRI